MVVHALIMIIGGVNLSKFQIWVLDVLNSLPQLQLHVPDKVKENVTGLLTLLDCFIVVGDFVPLLVSSVGFGFIALTHSVFQYVKGFSNYR